jgi:hypothetical protein
MEDEVPSFWQWLTAETLDALPDVVLAVGAGGFVGIITCALRAVMEEQFKLTAAFHRSQTMPHRGYATGIVGIGWQIDSHPFLQTSDFSGHPVP